MDSREAPPPPTPQNMMVGPTSYPMLNAIATSNNNSNAPIMISTSSGGGPTMIPPPTAARFPFNSAVSAKPLDSFNSSNNNNNAGPYDGSPPSRQSGFSIDTSSAAAKKKRGRPRKYSPDGNIALGLAPTPISSSSVANHGDSGSTMPSSEPPLKKHRGRPPGSGKKQLDALGTGGVGFTPHVIMVNTGAAYRRRKLQDQSLAARTGQLLPPEDILSPTQQEKSRNRHSHCSTWRKPTLFGRGRRAASCELVAYFEELNSSVKSK